MSNLIFYLHISLTFLLPFKKSIVSSCKIQDRVSGLRGEFQSQVDTSNLCKAMEDLLRLISELKVASIVQEVTDNRQESYELRGVYDNEVKFTERAIHSICENLLPALESLEAHYYRSCTTWATNQDAVTDNDQQRDRHVANPDDVTMADDQ